MAGTHLTVPEAESIFTEKGKDRSKTHKRSAVAVDYVENSDTAPTQAREEAPMDQRPPSPASTWAEFMVGTLLSVPGAESLFTEQGKHRSKTQRSGAATCRPPACLACRAAHAACSDERPCTRCVSRRETCVDEVRDVFVLWLILCPRPQIIVLDHGATR